MLLNYQATTAKKNVEKFEKREHLSELKQILFNVKKYSKQGHNGMRWKYEMTKATIDALTNLGYTVNCISHYCYEIFW